MAFNDGRYCESLTAVRWTNVSDDVIILRAANSKTRKPESIPLAGELHDIIRRRRSAAVWQDRSGQAHFSECVFHRDGQPIGNFRKSWATACCAAGIVERVCPRCESDVDAESKCLKCV